MTKQHFLYGLCKTLAGHLGWLGWPVCSCPICPVIYNYYSGCQVHMWRSEMLPRTSSQCDYHLLGPLEALNSAFILQG